MKEDIYNKIKHAVLSFDFQVIVFMRDLFKVLI